MASMLARDTVRWHRLLCNKLDPPLKNKKIQPIVKALLEVGILQLDATRVPPHAAVAATVDATAALGVGRTRGLVNAVLRGHQRDASMSAPSNPGVAHSAPDWLVEIIQGDWPDDWEAILSAQNEPAPMWLRNNRQSQSREELASSLADDDIETTVSAVTGDALQVTRPRSGDEIPALAAGAASVQDAGAQLAGDVVAVQTGQRVLDACAAPGNKTAHLLERGAGEVVSLDSDPERLERMNSNLARLGLQASTQVADASDRDLTWWDGQPFDRILIDAPCSGTGVIRRHPDIKWLRRSTDIAAAVERQLALLRALWPTLAADGALIYATCSILRAEGADVVSRFIEEQPDAAEASIAADWGRAETVGRRIAPGEHGVDGFYYAKLVRRQSP